MEKNDKRNVPSTKIGVARLNGFANKGRGKEIEKTK